MITDAATANRWCEAQCGFLGLFCDQVDGFNTDNWIPERSDALAALVRADVKTESIRRPRRSKGAR